MVEGPVLCSRVTKQAAVAQFAHKLVIIIGTRNSTTCLATKQEAYCPPPPPPPPTHPWRKRAQL